jgi:hypothetical protein
MCIDHGIGLNASKPLEFVRWVGVDQDDLVSFEKVDWVGPVQRISHSVSNRQQFPIAAIWGKQKGNGKT